MHYLIQFDRQLLMWVYQRRFRHIFPVKALIFMGDGPFWMIILFISALTGQLFKIESFSKVALLLMVGISIGQMVFAPLKMYMKRRRPYANLALQQDLGIEIQNRDPGHGSKEMESFPSGHVYWTTISVGLICSQFGWIAAVIFGWMIPTMMYLRPHLGVHYPSDALAGLVLGNMIVAVTLLVAPRLMEIVNGCKDQAGFFYVYWTVISLFLIVGYKAWLKRV